MLGFLSEGGMMPKKNAKKLRGDCERACEHYVHEILGCVVSCRAVRT